MSNKKGQALVEFIVLLPIIIYVILGMIDLIIIFSYKSNLDSKANEVITLTKNDKSDNEIKEYLSKDKKNITYEIKKDDKYIYINLEMPYDFITPGLNKLLSNFKIKSDRVVVNE